VSGLVDAARTVILAAIAWAGAIGAALAFVACVVAFCMGPLIAPATRAPRKPVTGPLVDEQPETVPESARARKRRPTPSWAHTERHSRKEAA
jgi:hypothetical protein